MRPTRSTLDHHSHLNESELFRRILGSLTDGVIVSDLDYKFLVFNTKGKEIVGIGDTQTGPEKWQETYGIFLEDEVTPCPTSSIPLARAVRGEEVNDFPVFVRNRARPEGVHLSVSGGPIRDSDECVIGGLVVFRDTTAEKRAFKALSESEQRWSSLVKGAPDFIITLNSKFEIDFINHTLPGLTPADVHGKSALDFLDEDQKEEAKKVLERVVETGVIEKFDVRAKKPDDSYGWFNCRVSPLHVGERVHGLIAIVSDITEIRENREKLAKAYSEMENRVAERTIEIRRTNAELSQSRDELRSLNDRIIGIQEEERTRIAREIHDVFGQALTALKFDLSWLLQRLGEDTDALKEKIAKMDGNIDRTIKTIRKISADLRPGVLDDLGLTAAIEWQTKEFEERTNLKCTLLNSVGDPQVTKEGAVAVFRVFQEALTNIMRHAEAESVVIKMDQAESFFVFEVNDDGKGIQTQDLSSRKSLGLLGIRERVAHVGGHSEIGGNLPTGTFVRVKIPTQVEG